jgi:hypothetical protein
MDNRSQEKREKKYKGRCGLIRAKSLEIRRKLGWLSQLREKKEWSKWQKMAGLEQIEGGCLRICLEKI